MSAICIF